MANKTDHIKKRLEIDKLSLDDELVSQAQLLNDVGEDYVEAVAIRDTLKEELATIDAELDGTCRTDLERKHEKYTEAMVKGAIQTHKRHKTAFDAYIKAKTDADRLGVLKESFKDRGFMLRDLASLYVSNYFDKSSVQGTNSTDRIVYEQRRRMMTEKRTDRNRLKETD